MLNFQFIKYIITFRCIYKFKVMSTAKKHISSSEAQARMRKLCEKHGINYTANQRQSGTASIRFTKKPKKD